jgi:hypothetical protein
MRKVLDVIWGKWEQKYFSEKPKKDSTALSTNRPTGKSLQPLVVHVDKLSPAKPVTSLDAMDGYRFRLRSLSHPSR